MEKNEIQEIRDKNNLVKNCEGLVNKLTKQFFDKGVMQWDQLKSMAYEGLALAINKYDPTRSKMTFIQYAAFSIRNHILSSLDNELRTVKMSNYAQKKAESKGLPLFTSVSLDNSKEDENYSYSKIKGELLDSNKFSDGDIFEYLYMRLESHFSKRDCTIFYMIFGLKDFPEMKGKEIAALLGISEGLISQKVKKMTVWIHSDKDLCEMLENLL